MFRIKLVVALALAAPVALAQQASEPAKPDSKKGAQIAEQVCAACHGKDGNSTIPANPKLAAQHPDYLVKQLQDFKPGDGKPAERVSAIMAGFASQLSEADIRDVATYFSAQTLEPSEAMHQDWVTLGQKIFRGGIAEKGVPACAGCHSPNGAGLPAQYPRLQGQFADYTAQQLTAFRQGERLNSVPMAGVANLLSDHEIKAVSDYIAGLR